CSRRSKFLAWSREMPTTLSPAPSPTVPVISAISPVSGPAGTVVTVTGSGFTNATAVNFGAIQASDVVVISDTQIKTNAPPGPVASVDMTVTTPTGTSTTSGGDRFAYVAPRAAPVVLGTYPNSGPDGTAVSIIGSGFTGATSVQFGGVSSPNVTVQ